MRRMMLAALGLALAGPAAAAEYRVELKQDGLLHGRFGLHAADSRTAGSLVRVISPGSLISRRGTVRVLVMNLGGAPFDFGPASVTLELADGSVLPEVPVAEFRRGERLVTRETQRAAIVRTRVGNDLAALAEAGATGPTAQALSGVGGGPNATAAATSAAAKQDDYADVNQLRAARMLDAIQSVLQPETVAPQDAAGGYLVFELPKALRERKADQPFTIVVKAGAEEHRIAALLRRD